MTGGLLYEHHQERNRRAEQRRLLLFLAAQVMHYGRCCSCFCWGVCFLQCLA